MGSSDRHQVIQDFEYCIWAETILDRRIKINKIQIGFIDIWNYGA
jgi:hypothetical protein